MQPDNIIPPLAGEPWQGGIHGLRRLKHLLCKYLHAADGMLQYFLVVLFFVPCLDRSSSSCVPHWSLLCHCQCQTPLCQCQTLLSAPPPPTSAFVAGSQPSWAVGHTLKPYRLSLILFSDSQTFTSLSNTFCPIPVNLRTCTKSTLLRTFYWTVHRAV